MRNGILIGCLAIALGCSGVQGGNEGETVPCSYDVQYIDPDAPLPDATQTARELLDPALRARRGQLPNSGEPFELRFEADYQGLTRSVDNSGRCSTSIDLPITAYLRLSGRAEQANESAAYPATLQKGWNGLEMRVLPFASTAGTPVSEIVPTFQKPPLAPPSLVAALSALDAPVASSSWRWTMFVACDNTVQQSLCSAQNIDGSVVPVDYRDVHLGNAKLELLETP